MPHLFICETCGEAGMEANCHRTIDCKGPTRLTFLSVHHRTDPKLRPAIGEYNPRPHVRDHAYEVRHAQLILTWERPSG